MCSWARRKRVARRGSWVHRRTDCVYIYLVDQGPCCVSPWLGARGASVPPLFTQLPRPARARESSSPIPRRRRERDWTSLSSSFVSSSIPGHPFLSPPAPPPRALNLAPAPRAKAPSVQPATPSQKPAASSQSSLVRSTPPRPHHLSNHHLPRPQTDYVLDQSGPIASYFSPLHARQPVALIAACPR
ncbi:hypothetical protein IWX90DRAFT_132729 [Phyllosticta citrichinensis]|uniref:Uncharacterized protein n=1 Tax=Phyllosticta citrichinensis TaxID=1130410 RepID=A0ABR1Y582_9PEZI